MSGVRVLADARAKWQRGREKYGEGWYGDPPLVELYGEYLDALNYIFQHEQENGRNEWTQRAFEMTLELAMAVKMRLDQRYMLHLLVSFILLSNPH